MASKSFFSEIISSISDAKFSHDGRFFMTRDYLTVKACCVIFIFLTCASWASV